MNKTKNQRNSAIELLRIIAIMGVVVLHYNNGQMGGGFQYVKSGSLNEMYLYLSESMFISSVNLFVMISGFFLCRTPKRRGVKAVELILQVILFSEAFYLLRVISGGEAFTIRDLLLNLIPKNYFVILYVTLYFISPYLNVMIENLSQDRFKKLIIMLLVLFSFWTIIVDYLQAGFGVTFSGASTIGMSGSDSGYTIVNFVLAYLIGAYISLYGVELSRQKNLLYIIVNLILIFAAAYGQHLLGEDNIIAWYYNDPLTISFAALVMLYVIRFQFESRFINEFAKGAFTCFLFHAACLPFMKIEQAVNSNLAVLFVHQILVSIVLYSISYVVYKIYSLCTGWFIKLISPLCSKLDIR